MANFAVDPNLPSLDANGKRTSEDHVFKDDAGNLFKMLKIPACLHDVMEFAGVQFAPKNGDTLLKLALRSHEWLSDPRNWLLTLPTNIPGKRVEIPINDPIDQSDPEGHWRAIIAAAADFQALVNTGQYNPA
jgi:hypothetical protein